MRRWNYFYFLLLLVLMATWLAVLSSGQQNLKLIACDVGQGDAILATYKNYQVLVDGGPNDKVIDCLSNHMPFWDRRIEVVVITHPQTDHYTGVIEVIKRYEVKMLLANNLDSSAREYQVLKELVGGKGISVLSPNTSQSIRLGLIQLDILHPSDNFLYVNSKQKEEPNSQMSSASKVSSQFNNRAIEQLTKGNKVLGAYTTKKDPNDFSIVTILSFKQFEALLTGDISPKISDEISKSGQIKDIDYIKIPHHGSKNGISKDLLEASMPEIAVISAGKNNRYGHPHGEVIKLLNDQGIKIIGTYEVGDVIVESDGNKIWLKR